MVRGNPKGLGGVIKQHNPTESQLSPDPRSERWSNRLTETAERVGDSWESQQQGSPDCQPPLESVPAL